MVKSFKSMDSWKKFFDIMIWISTSFNFKKNFLK